MELADESSSEEDTSDETYYIKHTREYRAECLFWQRKENERQLAFFQVDDPLDETQMRKLERLKSLLGSTADGKQKPMKKKNGSARENVEEEQERIVIPKSLSMDQRFNYTFTSSRWIKPDRYIKCI